MTAPTVPDLTSQAREGHSGAAAPHGGGAKIGAGVFRPAALLAAMPTALRSLDPRVMWHNPVMFVVEVGAVLSTILCFTEPSGFVTAVTVWLWLTVLFANLADAVAEGRGKAQAETLRRARQETTARRLLDWSPDAV